MQFNEEASSIDWSLYDSKQTQVLLQGLREGLDVSWYSDPSFSAGQMDAIWKGLRRGVDVSYYADPSISAANMNRYLERMLSKVK